MVTERIYPYYFPTTAVFIDDDRDFLLNFSLQLDEELSYQLFDSPHKGETYIRKKAMAHDRRSYFKVQEADPNSPNGPIISLSLADIHREMYNNQRFTEVSVLVVDYSMPGINGIDLCKALNDCPIKKILLTGKADEQIAIEAFNEGVIDRFVRKSDAAVVAKINKHIHDLQPLYFKDNADVMIQTLGANTLPFLEDPEFVRYFHSLCQKTKTVEYYLTDKPKGFLLVSEDAAVSQLLILSAEDLQVHHEIALDEGAPQALLDHLKKGDKIPNFTKTDGYYQKSLMDWQQYMQPSTLVEGRDRYYCAWLKPATFAVNQDRILSYNQYLDELDFLQD